MSGVGRREFLRRTGLVFGGVALGAPFLNACSGGGQPAGSAPQGSAGTGAAAATQAVGPKKPLKFIGWQYNPQIVKENVETFKQLYSEDVNYELVPGDYHAVAETKFIGGDSVDMAYGESERLDRWLKAGWIRDLEGLPGVSEIKASMVPAALASLSAKDGKFAALPYYMGYQAFLINDEHHKKLNLKDPTTWEEVIDQCRELKAKKVSEYPLVQMWTKDWPSLSWQLFADCYAEGEPIFDKDNNPTFGDGGVGFRKVVERWRLLYQDQLVPPNILTLQNEGVSAFQTGQHTFYTTHDYSQKACNDAKDSKIPGKVRNILYPGKTHTTLSWVACYYMGAKTEDPQRTWELLKFFGGKAKNGQYNVIKKWALMFGLGTPYKDVLSDPEVVQAFSQWKDLKVAEAQLANSKPRPVEKEVWFPEWNEFNTTKVQEFIVGKINIGTLLKESSAKVAEVKARYK